MIISFKNLMIIINPMPPMMPVNNLRVLLLSLNSNNWVNPSSTAGTHNNIPNNTYCGVYTIG